MPEENKKLPPIVFVLGGPGSGKGTQARRLAENHGFTHLSAGDLLRAEASAKEQTEVGIMINHYIKEGLIVPAEVTVGLLKKEILGKDHKLVLVDGFPRGKDQASEFRKQIGDCNFVLHLVCEREVMMKRLVLRGQTSGRIDDNMESILKRFDVQKQSCDPIIDEYSKMGKTHRITADGTPEEVYAAIEPLFKEFV